MNRVPRPHVVTVALVMTLTSALIMLVHSGTPHEVAGPSDSEADQHAQHDQERHIHEIVVPVVAVQPSRLPRTGWTVAADSQELVGENGAASNVLDGNPATIWHTKYINGTDPLPHTLTVDMKTAATVAGLQYLPRPASGSPNGRIGQYRVEVSLNGTTWGTPVATGTFADDATEKTAVFSGVSARFVRLTALTEAGGRGPWSTAAEINLLGTTTTTTTPTTTSVTSTSATTPVTTTPVTTTTTPPPTTVLPRTGWTVAADSQELVGENGAASNVLDGNPATIWHTKYINGTDPLPHTLTVDMKTAATVAGLRYLPRPASGSPNGRIGQYRVEVSLNGTTWGAPVATGTFVDDATEKTAVFSGVSARFVRLTALTEAGGRGPWSTAAEINLLGTTTPTTTPTTHVGDEHVGDDAGEDDAGDDDGGDDDGGDDDDDASRTTVLRRTGWTVAADSEGLVGENGAASNVLDGNRATIWHTKYIITGLISLRTR